MFQLEYIFLKVCFVKMSLFLHFSSTYTYTKLSTFITIYILKVFNICSYIICLVLYIILFLNNIFLGLLTVFSDLWSDKNRYFSLTLGPDILQTKSKNELIRRHFKQNQAETKFVLSSCWLFETAHQSKLSGGVCFGS